MFRGVIDNKVTAWYNTIEIIKNEGYTEMGLFDIVATKFSEKFLTRARIRVLEGKVVELEGTLKEQYKQIATLNSTVIRQGAGIEVLVSELAKKDKS